MNEKISNNRSDETIEAKVAWFRSLSLQERMDMLCSFTDLVLSVNPGILDEKDAEPFKGRVRVLSET